MATVNVGPRDQAIETFTMIKRRVNSFRPDLDLNALVDSILEQLDKKGSIKSPVDVGDHIVRIVDGRHFRVTYVNDKAANFGVFSSDSLDGVWSSWGGPLSFIVEGRDFIKISAEESTSLFPATGYTKKKKD